MRSKSSNNSGVSLRGLRNLTPLPTAVPPYPSEHQGRIGEDREQRPGGRRRTDKEDHQEFGDVAEEQRTEHPARGSDAGVQQPAVRLAPLAHGFRPPPPP